MVIVFTGNGKGKTTASLGQMVRAVGRGKNALMIQFIKGPWRSGEDEFSDKWQVTGDKSEGRFEVRKKGLGFVGILGDKLPRENHAKAAHSALEEFKKELTTGTWFLMILDEVNVAVSLGLITTQEVLEAVKDFPEDKLLIISGRGAPQEFIDRADLATEIREIKHPYNTGTKAMLAVEF